MLKPNVILMFCVVAVLGVVGWIAAGAWGVSTELVLGVFAGIAGIAGTTIRDLVMPPKSDVQLLLEHEREMAEIAAEADIE